jgi:peroxiredoxin
MVEKKNIVKVFFSCIFFLCCLPSQSQKKMEPNFKVSCYLKGSNGKKIILGNKPASGINASFKVKYYDSCYSVNDSFEFVFYLEEPSWYSIEIEGKKGWQSFVAVPDIGIAIIGNSDSLYKSKILGSKEDSLYNSMAKELLSPLYEAMYKSAPDSFKTIYPRLIREAKYNFIRQNSGSFISARYLVEADSYNQIRDTAQLHYLQKCYMALSQQAKQFTSSKNAYYNLFIANKTLTDQHKIPDFSVSNYEGTTFNLYKYLRKEKKKYYLIDFWATWCAPCVAQLPKLREVYDEYKNKGFAIIGYSLDVHQDKLEDFLRKQKLGWENLSDLKGNQSSVYKLFKLGTIPSNYLIDENGIIVATNITPENVSKILKEKLEREK